MKAERVKFLLALYDKGELSPDKWEELRLLLTDEDTLHTILADLKDTFRSMELHENWNETVQKEIWQLVKPTGRNASVHRVHFLKTAWFRYAATVILVLGAAAYFWTTNKKTQETLANGSKANPVVLSTDVAPGSNKAILTLADGSKITLDNTANGTLAKQGNTQIVKLDNGRLAYQLKGGIGSEVMLNTMSTPRGGQYQLILPDGSKVWLNAASSITYPAAFTGKQREVSITGEVYFEVEKNTKMPFQVNVNNQVKIDVLGTSFNVNAYKEEAAFKTSLVKGSIRVNNQILLPGQADLNGKLIKTNVEQDIAWKNDRFNFNDKSITEAMRQLARWYDLEIQYDKGIPDGELFGEIGRRLTLNDLLAGLEGVVAHFKLEGKVLHVSPL